MTMKVAAIAGFRKRLDQFFSSRGCSEPGTDKMDSTHRLEGG